MFTLKNGFYVGIGEYYFFYTYGYRDNCVSIVGVRATDGAKCKRMYDRSYVGCLENKERGSSLQVLDLDCRGMSTAVRADCRSVFESRESWFRSVMFSSDVEMYIVDLEKKIGSEISRVSFNGREAGGVLLKSCRSIDFSEVLGSGVKYRERELSFLEYLLLSRYYEGSRYIVLSIDIVNKVIHADSIRATIDICPPLGRVEGSLVLDGIYSII